MQQMKTIVTDIEAATHCTHVPATCVDGRSAALPARLQEHGA